MEALYFLKFRRPTSTNKDNQSSTEIAAARSAADTENEFGEAEEEREGGDSFFELELTVPADYDSNKSSTNNTATTTTNNNNNKKSNCPLDADSNRFDSKLENLLYTSSSANNNNKAAGNFQQSNKCQQQPTDLLSRRKILPFDQTSTSLRPQSPISLLKSSAPKFRVLMFKRSKSTRQKTERINNEAINEESSKLFAVKFWLEESSATNSKFTRGNSLREQIYSEESSSSWSSSSDHSSKRFSREAIQKYLKLINPLHIKVSNKKQESEKVKFSEELSAASPSHTPASSLKKDKHGNTLAGIWVVCKHLGRSKSASSATICSGLPANVRRDDSLTLQHDGIQSAILHCKRSFNSSTSRDSALFSRFASDRFHGKSMESPKISNDENQGVN